MSSELIEQGKTAELVDVIVRMPRIHSETLTSLLERDVATGVIETQSDYEAARIQHVQERADAQKQAAASLVAAIETSGGQIGFTCENGPCLFARIPASGLAAVASREDVLRMDLPSAAVELEGGAHHTRWGSQLDTYVDLPQTFPPYNRGMFDFDSQFDNLHVAVFDGPFATSHPSFLDGPLNHAPGDPLSRLVNYWSCATASPCVLYTFSSPNNLAANITPAWTKVFNHVIARSPKPVVMNMSLGLGVPNALSPQSDPNYPSEWDHCNGIDAISQGANDLFESGILLIRSAGNHGPLGNPSECTVTIPGSAAGVFTVANHGQGFNDNLNKIRNSPIYNGFSNPSSRGPNPATLDKGRGRSVIDLTASGMRWGLADESASGAWYDGQAGGTSFSAPVVSAAAVVFVDHYKRNFSNLIDNPGLLFANLLLMGDRAALVGGATTKSWTGFDSTFGGGRIKMRRFDDEGMGSPWGYLTGVECITAGETLQYHFTTSGQLPAGVDTVKFVTWWYDRRHELSDQNSIANIDLELWEIDVMGNKLVKLAESKSSTDDKERIVAVDPNLGGKYLLLEIQGVDGFDLNFDYGGCRLNGWITLYTAFYYESSDRNVDPEGPEWAQTADTWVGVEPESWSWP